MTRMTRMTHREDDAVAERGALRTPEQWCADLGARIMDHDGWRDGTRDWSEPIDRAEFDRRLLRCTIDSRGYPMHWTPPTDHESSAGRGGRGLGGAA